MVDSTAQNLRELGLFGLAATNSSRDFRLPDNWKKNIFNNAFPVALACYMGGQNIDAVYLTLDEHLNIIKKPLSIASLFGLQHLSPNLYYKFESTFANYEPLLIDTLPRIDLVTYDKTAEPYRSLRALEIKLTALPDNTTAAFSEDLYGCEIVVRPDSIVYLALSIAETYLSELDRQTLFGLLDPVCRRIEDWQTPAQVLPRLLDMVSALNNVMRIKMGHQHPLVLQPVWRTHGQRLLLTDQCFDLFVWSNFAFTRLFMGASFNPNAIQRPSRTVVWLTKMLYDFARDGKFNASQTITTLTYGPKNDKAFSVTGVVTRPLMACPELRRPRVAKEAVREIILGGGQDFMQPERRLDAAILTTPGLFPAHPNPTLARVLTEREGDG